MDWFGPEFGISNAEVDSSVSVLLVVGACLIALASSLCCSCSVSVGIFLVIRPEWCRALKCCG